jgi:rhodanese-related sulfurtransferase
MKLKTLLISIVLFLNTTCLFAASDFPLRAKYPDVQPVSMDELDKNYNVMEIVDVRSKMEFDVIHIAKAKHIQVTQSTFLEKLEELRSKEGATPIAFYCNGHTCAKSYKAAAQATDAGFKNIFCFDAGIFEWVDAYPERGSLLGQTPADKSKLISKEALQEKTIPFAQFKEKATQPNAIIFDTRDPFQRAKASDLPQNKMVDLSGIRNIPMDRMLALLNKKEFADKQLLIFDAVGKQVRWLQYHLEANGYKNYYFMEKGVLGAANAGGVK